MVNDNKKKSLIKDIAIVLCLWAPLLFIIIGGIIWRDDGFDGTLMEQLFPAIFFGFIAAYSVLLILSNLFQGVPKVWYIGAIVVFITTIVCWMLELETVLLYGAIIIGALLLLLCLIRWIADLKRKKEVSRYHIYGSDVKFDTDIQQQKSFSSNEKSDFSYDSTYNPFAEKKTSSSVKQRYCSCCGSVVDNDTKQCTGCRKQYFRGVVLLHNNWKKIINIITVVFLIISIGFNIVLFSKVNNQYTGLDKDDDFSYWSQNHDKVEFIDEHIVFVEDDGTDFYHKYECYKFVGNYFWAYNIELAEYNGYRLCPLCHDD